MTVQRWQTALEAGINKAWGGTKTSGYASTVNLVALVERILTEAGYQIIRWREVVPEPAGGWPSQQADVIKDTGA